ncbi:hypothetical protein GCM10011611_54810 [Aliidongia dinghuensis]|uniref:Uncharacterized protein n=1 Tax=Aliidongia dinghuensis TaxID=1867774 RepID=A0A8J2Z0B8_9PROT|nr:hypothetical protein [Aliidongia dinghuensis]GGF41411.1 hypothetical protein GCM10011611_54810 [Aliidongia dinghuensis]
MTEKGAVDECARYLKWQIENSLEFRLEQIEFAMEVGAVWVLARHLAADCVRSDRIVENKSAQEAIERARVWYDEAQEYERIHGVRSKLDRSHPFVGMIQRWRARSNKPLL